MRLSLQAAGTPRGLCFYNSWSLTNTHTHTHTHTHRYGLCCHTVCRPVCVCVCVCVCECVCVPSQSFPLLSAVSSWADQVHSGLSQHTDSKGQQWVYTWRLMCNSTRRQVKGAFHFKALLCKSGVSTSGRKNSGVMQKLCHIHVFSRDAAKLRSFPGG